METFLKSSEIKSRKTTLDESKIETFIKKFNNRIKSGKENADGSFSLNTTLAKIPTLNNVEFDRVSDLANRAGWLLKRTDDNHNSTTYTMTRNL